MGKYATLLVAAGVLFGAHTLMSIQQSTLQTEQQYAEHGHHLLAREIALAGFKLGERKLKEDPLAYSGSFTADYQSGTYTVTVTNPPPGSGGGEAVSPPVNESRRAVTPILECVDDNGDGTFTAYFGYENDYTDATGERVPLEIPYGPNNKLNQADLDGAQPEVFQVPDVVEGRPGRTPWWPGYAFKVAVANNRTLVWTLNGRTTTARAGSTACGAGDEPELWLGGSGTISIASEGEINGERFTIYAEYERTSEAGDGGEGGDDVVPDFMDYGLISDNDLIFNGSSQVWPAGYPYAHTYNADVHANNRLTVNGNSDFRGFGTFSAEVNDPGILNRTSPYFNPPFSPDGEGAYDASEDPATYRQVDPVEVPTFDADAYRDIADEVYLSGNKQYKRTTITGGTREDPLIIYVDNELQIKNNVTITGYVMFIVRGNIVVRGSFTNIAPDPTESNIAFYTESDLIFNGSADFVGQALARNLVMNGSGRITGTIATQGNLIFNGSRQITYRPASSALTEDIWPPTEDGGDAEESVVLLTYREMEN